MQELKSVPEIVKKLKVSADKIRYWVSLLGAKTIRKGRVSFLTLEIISQVEMMARLVDEGISPKEASKKVLNTIIPEEAKITVSTKENKKFETLEKAVLIMADQIRGLSDQVKELRRENNILRIQLTPPVVKTNVIPWTPKKTNRKSYPWYKKIWLELISPEALRTNP